MSKPISKLAELTNLTGNEESVLVVNGTNYRFKLRNLKFLVPQVTKEDIGLGNVDNTSDADKPISLATAEALSFKSPVNHTHTVDDIEGLTSIPDTVNFTLSEW